MKQFVSWTKWAGVGAIALVSISGCGSNTSEVAENMGQGAENMSQAAENTVENAGQVAENVGQAAENTVENAGQVGENMAQGAENTVENAGEAVENGVEAAGAPLKTADIKAAILANPAVKGANLNVTTKDKTVTLTGTVSSEAQKTAAGKIAGQQAKGYKIVNQLKVQGG